MSRRTPSHRPLSRARRCQAVLVSSREAGGSPFLRRKPVTVPRVCLASCVLCAEPARRLGRNNQPESLYSSINMIFFPRRSSLWRSQRSFRYFYLAVCLATHPIHWLLRLVGCLGLLLPSMRRHQEELRVLRVDGEGPPLFAPIPLTRLRSCWGMMCPEYVDVVKKRHPVVVEPLDQPLHVRAPFPRCKAQRTGKHVDTPAGWAC